MADDLVHSYGSAVIAIGRAEGVADRVADELYQFAAAVDGRPELRATLTDPSVALEARSAAVAELLGRAHPATGAAVQMLLAADRIRHISEIADAAVTESAEARGASVAQVRSAKPLGDAQRRALESALTQRVGRPVELKVTVDPDLLGGVVVQLGDTVIDGSMVKRLTDLRSSLATA
ncbi:ATP synthase F1 subunit delta [Euzebya sp.]|uniref:ATP synthase F1 subunit delta n=1 Tax=Euzebya sp. TaxID=1971409 RepID=UPI0035161179